MHWIDELKNACANRIITLNVWTRPFLSLSLSLNTFVSLYEKVSKYKWWHEVSHSLSYVLYWCFMECTYVVTDDNIKMFASCRVKISIDRSHNKIKRISNRGPAYCQCLSNGCYIGCMKYVVTDFDEDYIFVIVCSLQFTVYNLQFTLTSFILDLTKNRPNIEHTFYLTCTCNVDWH